MPRPAHIAALFAVTGLAACGGGGAYAPIEHRGAQGAPIERGDAGGGGRPASGAVATSRIVSTQQPASRAEPAVVLPERPDSIVIQPGDTLFAITERYRLSLDQVIEANNLREPYTLIAGRTLILPQWPSYTVRAGDTVSEIALAANVDMPSLLLLNYIPDPDNLRVGQVLILPELPYGGLGPQAEPPAPAAPGAAPAPAPGPRLAEAAPDAPAITSTRAATGAAGRFIWPVQGEIISDFGPKGRGQRNDGVNIRANEGDPVRAAAAGQVIYVGNEVPAYGELVMIKHDDGWITLYAHNSRLLVADEARVAAGEVIAEVGSTGSVDAPQLHFEVRNGVQPVDPMQHLPPA